MRLHWNTRPLPDCKWTDWSTELTCAFSFLSPSSNQLHQGNPCHFPKQRFPTGLLDFLLEEKKKVKTSCGLNVNNACLELHSRIKLMQWVQRFAFLTSIKDPHSYPSHIQFGAKVKQEMTVPLVLPESRLVILDCNCRKEEMCSSLSYKPACKQLQLQPLNYGGHELKTFHTSQRT